MYLRRKCNASGSFSVQVVHKVAGRLKVLKTIGSGRDDAALIELELQGRQQIMILQAATELPFHQQAEAQFVEQFRSSIQQLRLVGPELLLGKLFDDIGFGAIEDDLFRHLVITRLVMPVSKLRTVDYLAKSKGLNISVYAIYRYMDKLHKNQLDQVKAISLTHTQALLGEALTVVFYDVTTLYFEIRDEDDLRRMGFSKDGKHQQPQIVLGLLVSQGGYPLDYDVFEGSKYEGDTLLPIVEHFVAKHNITQLIVVADAGMLSRKNVEGLSSQGHQYILGARIKAETKVVQDQIMALNLKDGQHAEVGSLADGSRLIISYKKARAATDLQNRKRGLEKLEKRVKAGKLTKEHLNQKGYNKYLSLKTGSAEISIDYSKFKADAKWDGLKGYRTNTQLSSKEVIERYHQLWEVERTFRISKHDLQIRPVFHQLRRRIEAHICIAFAACKLYRELERQLKAKGSNWSAQQAIDIASTILLVEFTTPYTNTRYTQLLINTSEQLQLAAYFNLQN